MADQGLQAQRRQRRRELVELVCGADLVPVEPDGRVPFTPDYRYDHRYGRLAERIFCAMALRAQESGNERVVQLIQDANVALFGCYVLTKILSYAPDAYRAYCAQMPEVDPSVVHLGEIMLRSASILDIFADVGRREGRERELAYGLRQYPPTYEPRPFVIRPDENGVVTFQPSLLTQLNAALSAAYDPETLDELSANRNERTIHCPAVGNVLKALWGVAVRECVERPELFQADLAQA